MVTGFFRGKAIKVFLLFPILKTESLNLQEIFSQFEFSFQTVCETSQSIAFTEVSLVQLTGEKYASSIFFLWDAFNI